MADGTSHHPARVGVKLVASDVSRGYRAFLLDRDRDRDRDDEAWLRYQPVRFGIWGWDVSLLREGLGARYADRCGVRCAVCWLWCWLWCCGVAFRLVATTLAPVPASLTVDCHFW